MMEPRGSRDHPPALLQLEEGRAAAAAAAAQPPRAMRPEEDQPTTASSNFADGEDEYHGGETGEYHDTHVSPWEERKRLRGARKFGFGARHNGAFKELTALAQGYAQSQQPKKAQEAHEMARAERLKAQRALHYVPS